MRIIEPEWEPKPLPPLTPEQTRFMGELIERARQTVYGQVRVGRSMGEMLETLSESAREALGALEDVMRQEAESDPLAQELRAALQSLQERIGSEVESGPRERESVGVSTELVIVPPLVMPYDGVARQKEKMAWRREAEAYLNRPTLCHINNGSPEARSYRSQQRCIADNRYTTRPPWRPIFCTCGYILIATIELPESDDASWMCFGCGKRYYDLPRYKVIGEGDV